MQTRILTKKRKFEKEINEHLTLKAWVWDIIEVSRDYNGLIVGFDVRKKVEVYDIWNFKTMPIVGEGVDAKKEAGL